MTILEALIGIDHGIYDHVIEYDCIYEHVDVMVVDQLQGLLMLD